MQRHSFQAEIRRGRNPAAQAIEGLAGGRLDAPPGHEHGGEEHKGLIEAVAKVEAPAGGPAPEAEAEAPEAESEEGAPAEKEIKLPDIEVPALAEIGKSDSIFTWFGYTTSKARGGAQPTGFGVTRSFSSKLTGVKIIPLPWSYMVSATLEHPVTWQVRSGTGPQGQVDITSAGNSNITAANFAAVADDLTPDMSDLNGRPPRGAYWAEDLTIRHELVHVADDQANGPAVTTQVSNWAQDADRERHGRRAGAARRDPGPVRRRADGRALHRGGRDPRVRRRRAQLQGALGPDPRVGRGREVHLVGDGIEIPRAAGPGDAALDEQARTILERAGMDIRAALASGHPVFQASAARLVGAEGQPAAGDDGQPSLVDAVAALAANPAAAETARVEAAYALARLGDDRGREHLVELLNVPTAISPAALQAAGRLARLGDTRGAPLIAAALRSPARLDAMVAAKELDAFDSKELYDLALAHPEASVQGEARARLAR
jgi:hypothetical protein